jgi:adenosylcobinamide-GDP ribazoletransferase
LFYPLVGLLIGIVLSLLAESLSAQPAMVAASLLLLVWVVITGALHLDGLADSADAWLGGIGNKARTLSIMKDPAAGPIAVATVVLVLLLKFVMLTVLLTQQNWAALIWSVILARTALPLLFLTTDYVRPQGLGSILKQQQSATYTRRLLLAVSLIAFFSIGLYALLFALAVFLLLRYMMERRLNGFTGDTAGAMVELLETVLLIFFVLF